ncbi:MAG: Zn-dependent oligopeptidase [Betaproteobacteria bacterium]|nr:Zn-dependent oligopeptidase [Betaproteobacteria bacterium]
MSRTLACLALVLAWNSAHAAEPARPLIGTYDAAIVTRLCDEGLARARASIARMEAKRGGAGFLDEWNRLQIEMEDVVNPIYLMGSVHPDKAVRDAADPCLTKYTTLSTELFQSEKLFARAKSMKPGNPRQAKLQKDVIEGFEDTGVALPEGKRNRAKEIFDRLETLRQDFDKSVRDDPTKVVFSPAEMEGMPEDYVKAQKRDADGNYVLGLDYPAYVPFMNGAKSEAARKRYYLAKQREGGEGNLGRLDEIFGLRKELAALYDLPSFAHYSLRRKMVGKPGTVMAFLAEVKGAVTDLEKKELEDLRAEKAKDAGRPLAEVRIERWDVNYWQERVRRARYAIDQEALRKYFPTDKAIAFTLELSQTLYGVKFAERKVPVWDPDVRYFDVSDARSGAFLSGFYLDLFPREGKYNHAAAFPVRGVSLLAKRTPVSVLVTNFNRSGLDHEEMETLLHEFGHVLHGVLAHRLQPARRNQHAARLRRGAFADVRGMGAQRAAARALREGLPGLPAPREGRHRAPPGRAPLRAGHPLRAPVALRRLRHGALDGPAAVDGRVEAHGVGNPLGHVEGTMFPASFSHIAAHYAAGYYGYMWSEVLALDMLSKFSKNLLDPKVGRFYRDTILAQGGQVEPADMVRKFLGREPSREAFFAEITGRR